MSWHGLGESRSNLLEPTNNIQFSILYNMHLQKKYSRSFAIVVIIFCKPEFIKLWFNFWFSTKLQTGFGCCIINDVGYPFAAYIVLQHRPIKKIINSNRYTFSNLTRKFQINSFIMETVKVRQAITTSKEEHRLTFCIERRQLRFGDHPRHRCRGLQGDQQAGR